MLIPPTAIIQPLLPFVAGLVSAAMRARRVRVSTKSSPVLFDGTRWFEAGQAGVSYEDFLLPYLVNETVIRIVDPHIKTARQIRNFRELLDGLARDCSAAVDVHLITGRASGGFGPEYRQAQLLFELLESAAAKGINLTVGFDDSNHDRWITTSRWTILMGRGLDIWEPNSCTNEAQQHRAIRQKFTVTYTRRTD